MKTKRYDLTLLINIILSISLFVIGACELTKVTVYGNNNTISTEEGIKADSINTNLNLKGK